jgi:hypothetical protein
MNFDRDLNYRFRSLPEAPDLEFPRITPSGLSIGTMMVMTLHRELFTFCACTRPQD